MIDLGFMARQKIGYVSHLKGFILAVASDVIQSQCVFRFITLSVAMWCAIQFIIVVTSVTLLNVSMTVGYFSDSAKQTTFSDLNPCNQWYDWCDSGGE